MNWNIYFCCLESWILVWGPREQDDKEMKKEKSPLLTSRKQLVKVGLENEAEGLSLTPAPEITPLPCQLR